MSSQPSPTPPRPFVGGLAATLHARRGVLTALAVLAGLGVAANSAWRVFEGRVARGPQYLINAASVVISPPPPWVGDQVSAAVFRVAGLENQLSILDPPEELEKRLAEAYVAHPWVRRVGAIRKTPPNRVTLELEYRTPLAAVELGGALIPVDVDGAVLPTHGLSSDAVRYLPRVEIVDPAVAPPAAGAVWPEPRLAGALSLIDAFGPSWRELNLFMVRIDRTPDVRAGQRFWSYNLISTGNTVVVWGAAPAFAPADEAPFARKLDSLRRAVNKHGPLDSVTKSPALIDVRDGAVAYPRVVMKDKNRLAAKDDDEAKVK